MSDPSRDVFKYDDDSIECVVDYPAFPSVVRVDNGAEIESYVRKQKYYAVVDIAMIVHGT